MGSPHSLHQGQSGADSAGRLRLVEYSLDKSFRWWDLQERERHRMAADLVYKTPCELQSCLTWANMFMTTI